MSMNHLPAILSLLVALAVGYLTLTVESKVVHQQHAIELLRRELDDTRKEVDELAKTNSFLDDQVFALKEDLKKAETTPAPPTSAITRAQLDAALTENMLMVDEKLKPLITRPIELKIWDMANPTAEVTPLVPPPGSEGKDAKKSP
jgi:hypothetical protein